MRILLLLLCVAELLLITWWRNVAGPLVSPILFLAASCGIGMVYLRIKNTPTQPVPTGPKLHPALMFALQLLPFIILSYLVFKTNKTIWWWHATIDNGVDRSDIIPQISMLVKRFLAQEQPYYPIPYTGYSLFPTYLPLQWMPYILTEWLHKDYRWIPVIGMWLSSFYFFMKTRKADAHLAWRIVLPVWPLAIWYAIVMQDNDMFKLTVEALIAGYYLFVAANIEGRRAWPLAIGIAICLLSRYSIIFWVPLCLACYYVSGERRKALIIVGTALAMFLVFYWFPFLRKDPMIFFKGYQYHTAAAYGEWYNDLTTLHGKFYMYNGLGFTAWALQLIPGDLHHQLSVYQKVHLLLCFSTVTALFYYYWKKKASLDLNSFLLFSFKVYLAVFYAFIQIPYKYLYIVPVVVSGALLASAFRRNGPAPITQV